MVEGAYRRFCQDGYAGASMTSIAAEAGVAVQTLYYTFGAKAALLDAALGGAVMGFDRWRDPPPDPDMEELATWNSWWSDLDAAPTTDDALEVFVTSGADVLERVAPLLGAVHGAGGDSEAEEVVRVAQERRVEAYAHVARVIAAKPGGLRGGLTASEAADILVVMLSAELYWAMRHDRGWSRSHCRRFLMEVLRAQLLGSP